ncbi:Cystatin/monellin superfamily protein [Thalictrum thalictroides]|uniref:Cystatin/monellin superfamily protein n=1 Tax=Thalictrum thalictroides TaxID=46969 RepID=A0A7J6VT65_THATH|nr:Cystatin/monellin superfamily protein [Thalictrum thalictroides]
MQTQPCLAFLLLTMFPLIFTFAIASFPSSYSLNGGFLPINDVTNPHIREIGEFAVNEHNKQVNSDLVFDFVIKGEVKDESIFKLFISARDNGMVKTYLAVVYERAPCKYDLESFLAEPTGV